MISHSCSRGQACATPKSSKSSSISCTTTSPRVTRSEVHTMSEHTGAHRDGYSDEKCRDVLVRFCSGISRNYNYTDGLQLVYEKLREYLGDENLDLSSGVLFELIEVPSQFTSDEGAAFRRWKHDHSHRNGDLENGHVPRLGNVVISQVVPTKRLRHWRECRTTLDLSGSSEISSAEATKGDLTKRYGIKGRSEWQINHTLYMSSRLEGTRVVYCPTAKEFHELSWNYGHGSGGTLIGKKIILEEDKSPPRVSAQRVLGFAKVQPLPRSTRAMIIGAIKKMTVTSRHQAECLALFVAQQKNENDIQHDHMSRSVLEYENQDAYRNLPDVNSVQGRIYYAQIPNFPLPEAVKVNAQFARKYDLISPGENFADLKIVKPMPTAEDLAITRGVEACRKGSESKETLRWHSNGPETAQLFKDDGSMAYEWLRSPLNLSGHVNYHHSRPLNVQPYRTFDGADDYEEPSPSYRNSSRLLRLASSRVNSITRDRHGSRTLRDRFHQRGAVSGGYENENEGTTKEYNAVTYESPSRPEMRLQDSKSGSLSKADTSHFQKTASQFDGGFGNKTHAEGIRAFKGSPLCLKLANDLADMKEEYAFGQRTTESGHTDFHISDEALTLCSTPVWATTERLSPSSSVGVSGAGNGDTTLERATNFILPDLAPSSKAKFAPDAARQFEVAKYHPSVGSYSAQPHSAYVRDSEAIGSSSLQNMPSEDKHLKTSSRKRNREETRNKNLKHVHQPTLDILEGRAGPDRPFISPPDATEFYINAISRMHSRSKFENQQQLDSVDRSKSAASASSKTFEDHNKSRDESQNITPDVSADESKDGRFQIDAPLNSARCNRLAISPSKFKRQRLRTSLSEDFADNEVIRRRDSLDRDPFIDFRSTLKSDRQIYELKGPKFLPNTLSNIQHNRNQTAKDFSSFPIAVADHNQHSDIFSKATRQQITYPKIPEATAEVILGNSQTEFDLNTILRGEVPLSDRQLPDLPYTTTPVRLPSVNSQKLTPKQRSGQTLIAEQRLQHIRYLKYLTKMSSPDKPKVPSGIMGNFVPLEPPDQRISSSSAAREISKADNAKFYEEIAKGNPYGPEPTSERSASSQNISRSTELGDFITPDNLQRSNSMRSSQLHTSESTPDVTDQQRAPYDQNPVYNAPSPLKSPQFDEKPHSPARSNRLSQSINKQLPTVPEVDETEFETSPSGQLINSPSPGKKLFGEGGWLGTSMDPNEGPPTLVAKAKSKPGMMTQVKTAMQEMSRKVDFSPVKMLQNAFRKEKEVLVVSTPISLSPAQQAQVYVDLELIISAVANRFLVYEAKSGRMNVESAQKISDFWRKQGRDQVIEFQYDQSTQRDLMELDLEVLRFYGDAACNPVQISALLHTWKAAAREMAVRTFCYPDTVIDKHLLFAYRLLELLGAETVFFMSLQETHGTFNDIVEAVREGQQLNAGQPAVSTPSLNSAMFTSGNADRSTSKSLQRSQSLRLSIMSGLSRSSGGSNRT